MKPLLLLPLLLVALPVQAQQPEVFDGRPAFGEGVELGYYVWREGDTWHLRWTTRGALRRFSGAVTADGGKLKSLKRIDVESERTVLYPGRPRRVWVGPKGRVHAAPGRAPVVVSRDQDKVEKDGDSRIVFLARTDDDIDGFDFKVDDEVTALRFALEIDGRPASNLVELGAANQRANRLPLLVKLR